MPCIPSAALLGTVLLSIALLGHGLLCVGLVQLGQGEELGAHRVGRVRLDNLQGRTGRVSKTSKTVCGLNSCFSANPSFPPVVSSQTQTDRCTRLRTNPNILPDTRFGAVCGPTDIGKLGFVLALLISLYDFLSARIRRSVCSSSRVHVFLQRFGLGASVAAWSLAGRLAAVVERLMTAAGRSVTSA